MRNQDTFVLRWFFGVIRRWLWLILICTTLAGIAGFLIYTRVPPVYKASVVLFVEPSNETVVNEYSALIAAERLAQTYSVMLESNMLLSGVIHDLGLETTTGTLSQKITAQPIQDTQLVRLTVEDESPEQAARIANHLAESFAAYIYTTHSERYAGSLAEIQNQLRDIDETITAHQSQIDELQAQVIEGSNQLAQLQASLEEIRTDTFSAQEDYQEIETALAQVKEQVKIFQSASAPTARSPLPYKATVLLLVKQELATGITDYSSILASERLTQTYAQIIRSRTVLQEAITQLGLTQSIEIIQERVTVEPVAGTQLIQLSVTDYDTTRAANLANAIAEVFVRQTQEALVTPYLSRFENVEKKLAELNAERDATQAKIEEISASNVQAEIEIRRLESLQTADQTARQDLQDDYDQLQKFANDSAESVYITDFASIPESPVTNPLLYLGLAVVMGAIVGLGFAFLLEVENDTIRTAEDVSTELGVRVLGKIGLFINEGNSPVVINHPTSPISEAFIMLANNIRFATLDQPAQLVTITSPSPDEGKTVVLANLAVTMARLKQNVVAVDADMRVPGLHKQFGLQQAGGLTDALLDGSVEEVLKEVNVNGLKVLPCGKLPSSPTEVIGAARMHTLLNTLKDQADIVLIDCPPVLPVAETIMLANMADYTILVLRANHSHIRVARDALLSLQQAGVKVIGAVLNSVPPSSEENYSYAYRPNEKQKINLARLLNKIHSAWSGLIHFTRPNRR